MSRVKSSDTSIEVKLRKSLWHLGYRYRKNCKEIFGKPDICFKKRKIAIFCDSEFWHGKKYLEHKAIPKTHREYWVEKFERNIQRDKEVTQKLQQEGWIVLRFWEKDINHNLKDCVDSIVSHFSHKTSPCD